MPLAALLAFTFKDPPHTRFYPIPGKAHRGRFLGWVAEKELFRAPPGTPGSGQVAACLERRFLFTKLHRLVEDRRQDEIFTKLTTFKKINICSLSVVLAAAPFKCGATRLTLRLLPGGESGLGCAGGWAPASDVVAY